MVEVGKTGSPSSSAGLAGARTVPGARSVISTDRMAVEGISAEAGVSFDNATFRDEEDAHTPPGDDDHAPEAGPLEFTATSQAFAAMFELPYSRGTLGGGTRGFRPAGFFGLLSAAIDTYETNTRIICGRGPGRGGSPEMTL